MNWVDALPTLDTDVPLFYRDADDEVVRDVAAGIDAPEPLRRTGPRRYVNALHVANARDTIRELPAPGESIHGIMSGGWDAWTVVPLLIELAGDAAIKELNIATLGFNKDNTLALLELIDAGQIGHVTFICSHFYKSHEGDVVAMLANELAARGCRFAALRCHAKILLCEFTDGRHLVWESSANLRSCRNIEQYVLTEDATLLHFHREWMTRLIGEAGG